MKRGHVSTVASESHRVTFILLVRDAPLLLSCNILSVLDQVGVVVAHVDMVVTVTVLAAGLRTAHTVHLLHITQWAVGDHAAVAHATVHHGARPAA